MLANVIEYDDDRCVIDGCFEFGTSKEQIERLVDEVNRALIKGELDMTGAYYTILTNLGCKETIAKAICYHHAYGRKITLEDNFWEEED